MPVSNRIASPLLPANRSSSAFLARSATYVRPLLRPAIALTVASFLLACLLSFHPLDSSPLNLRTSFGGVHNIFGLLGALLAGALLEPFGGAALLLPLLIFSRICFPQKQVSALRYWLIALLVLSCLAFLLALLHVSPSTSLQGSGWIGWSSQNWAQNTIGRWPSLAIATIAFCWLAIRLKPTQLTRQTFLHTCYLPFKLISYFLSCSFQLANKTARSSKRHKKCNDQYHDDQRQFPPQKSSRPQKTVPTAFSPAFSPESKPFASASSKHSPIDQDRATTQTNAQTTPSQATEPESTFHQEWQKRCKSWQENMELDWKHSSDYSK